MTKLNFLVICYEFAANLKQQEYNFKDKFTANLAYDDFGVCFTLLQSFYGFEVLSC